MTPSMNPSVVVFSDFDQPLVHLHKPSFLEASARILGQLPADNVALVLCSSKTRAELEFIRDGLAISDPFICEHGAAVMIPVGYFAGDLPHTGERAGYRAVEFGRPYADIVETLHQIARRMKVQIVGFADMSIERVAQECRLTLMEARLAKLRDYDELFRIVDDNPSARQRLVTALRRVPLRCTAGDPFDTVGAPVDYRTGVRLLTDCYRREFGDVRTLGISDASRLSNLVGVVDDFIPASPEVQRIGSQPDVVDWAESIVRGVQPFLQRTPDSRRHSQREEPPGASQR